MDKAQFEKKLKDCDNMLKRYVYYKMPQKADADDILQETYITAFTKYTTLKNLNGFKAWILQIAKNKINDFYRKRHSEVSIDDVILENAISPNRYGLNITEIVQETLELLDEKNAKILQLFYIEKYTQAEIASILNIPIGTVKSRLYTAKKHFKEAYPYKKGEKNMLPKKLPDYTIVKSEEKVFPVKWKEMMGWFIVPRLGEKLSWAMYDYPEKTRSEAYELEVIGYASVHGIDGVEITAIEHSGGQHEHNASNRNISRTFIAQLTDTHCRILAQIQHNGNIKQLFTFLDGDDFINNWGFGEDNCGNAINLEPKETIKREGNIITAKNMPFLLDVVGRYIVTIGGKSYDCICIIDIETYNSGVMSEQFIDKHGRTVLWRRFNSNNWNIKTYKQHWSERLPNNERLYINDELYVHWYDCITDYIL